MMMADKSRIDDLEVEDAVSLKYFEIPDHETWRANLLKEIVNMKNDVNEVNGIAMEELDQIMNYICTS